MKNKIVIIFLALALVLTACAPKLVSVHSAAPLAAATAAPAEALKAYGQGGGITNETSGVAQMPATDNSNPAGSPATATQDRLVLTNVDLSIVVADPQKKMDSIAQMAKDMGGFVVSSNLSPYYLDSGTTVSQGTISIRIPADKLEQALTQIKTGVGEVRSEARTGQDVTAQYVDLQSSLRNLEQEETDLQDIMDEAKNNPNSNTTSKTQDVLTVYNQIVSVRG
ncbi:MAG TPA: DUF4349 domain-containing protein, partial [Anaerolineales bacterium]|nr:DUF4349 domain-containing protein [Anaerolineales bacterium]